MYFIIYRIVNLINNKEYIGKHQTDDLSDGYMGSGRLIKNAIKKYGIENFTKDILFMFDNEYDMGLKEQELVNEGYVNRKDTYNLSLGGVGGFSGNINGNASTAGKVGRTNSNKTLEQKYGPDWRAILNRKRIEKHPNIMKEMNARSRELYPNGPFRGHSHTDTTKKLISQNSSVKQAGPKNSQYNTCWITKDSINKKIPKTELDLYLTLGYKQGRVL